MGGWLDINGDLAISNPVMCSRLQADFLAQGCHPQNGQ
jgi:hypothetical protein